MSISLDSAGALVIKSSGTGANSRTMTISAPTSLAANRAISIADPGADSFLSTGVAPVIGALTGAQAITQAMSGSIINLDHTTAGAITLPVAIAGLNYKFVVGTGVTTKDLTLTPTAGTFCGYLIGSATVVACAAKATIVLTGAKALLGDSIDVYCAVAGNWQVRGTSQTAAYFA
jgi:hypothetical protein